MVLKNPYMRIHDICKSFTILSMCTRDKNEGDGFYNCSTFVINH